MSEGNVVDESGVIIYSTNPDFIGYHMDQGEQSRDFLILLDGQTQAFAQEYGEIALGGTSRKYAGLSLPWDGFLQVGYDEEMFSLCLDYLMAGVTSNRHVGETGFVFIIREDGEIVSGEEDRGGKALESGPPWPDAQGQGSFSLPVYGKGHCCLCDRSEGYYILAALPWREVFVNRDASLYLTAVSGALVFAAVFLLISRLVRTHIVKSIQETGHALEQITEGDLDVTVEVGGCQEFTLLSQGINATVARLKAYIAEAAARLSQELEYAKAIQRSALPRVFPPYPHRREFGLFASMRAAKEVGGDFYDFTLLDENRLAFLIADVSDKGIPAAMFMMTVKTLLRGLAESGLPPEAVFTQANQRLCADNDTGMFVTAWMGVLELDSGRVRYANAAHNPPVLLGAGGKAQLVRGRPGFVLGGLPGTVYRPQELSLSLGDALFLYTDGVTEAANGALDLFGTPRLLQVLEEKGGESCQAICEAVQARVDAFAGSAPQADDMTMLALAFHGLTSAGKSLRLPADLSALEEAEAFVGKALGDAPPKALAQLGVAVDEVFSNIARYSGASAVEIGCEASQGSCQLWFLDDGVPYDPTTQPEPDTGIPAEEREPGGLGILIVRRTMDRVEYCREAGRNRLTLEKTWGV